jgi:hypothetical protein
MENTQSTTSNTQNTTRRDTEESGWEERRWTLREERRKLREDMREARHRWPFHGFFWGLTLILFGVLFLLDQTGAIYGDTWWQLLLIGLGSISIIDGIVRYFSPGYHWGIFGKIVGGIVMVMVGALFLAGVSEWWPVILIGAGAAFIFRFVFVRAGAGS